MSARLLWLHEHAMLATIPGDLRRRPIRCNPLPDVLGAPTVDDCAPAYDASRPEDLDIDGPAYLLRDSSLNLYS